MPGLFFYSYVITCNNYSNTACMLQYIYDICLVRPSETPEFRRKQFMASVACDTVFMGRGID